jgi:hypothetical protein
MKIQIASDNPNVEITNHIQEFEPSGAVVSNNFLQKHNRSRN